MITLTAAIRDHAVRSPTAPALIEPDGAILPYQALDRGIDQVSARLRRLGLAPGQTVTVPRARTTMRDEATALILGLALARIGVAVTELPRPGAPAETTLLPAGAPMPETGGRVIVFDRSWLDDQTAADRPPLTPHDGAATLRIVPTSGTSGMPRHCVVTHAMMAARVAGNPFPATGGGRPVLLCAIGGTAALLAMLTTFSAGGTVVLHPAGNVFDGIVRHGVTAIFCGPAWLRDVIAAAPAGGTPPPALEAVVVTGSPLPAPLADKAARILCPNIVIQYGATETGPIALGLASVLETPFGAGVGIVLPDAQVEVLDETGAPLPPGDEGLLRIRTAGMIAGYEGNPQATATGFRDGWFYPGDVGLVTQDGVLVLSGRINEIINTGGTKISPRRIEAVLLTFPGISQAAAFGMRDDDGLAVVWAAVVTAQPLDGRSFYEFCRARLGPAAPRATLCLADLPRNANGKVSVAALAELARRQQAAAGR